MAGEEEEIENDGQEEDQDGVEGEVIEEDGE